MNKLAPLALGLLLLAPAPLYAQQAAAERPGAFARERNLITSTLQTVISVLREATLGTSSDEALADRLRAMTSRLSNASRPFSTAPPAFADAPPPSQDDLQQLATLLRETLEEVQGLREALASDDAAALDERLASVEERLTEATQLAVRLAGDEAEDDLDQDDVDEDGITRTDDEGWLRPGTYRAGRAVPEQERGPWHAAREGDEAETTRPTAAEEAREAMAEARARAYGAPSGEDWHDEWHEDRDPWDGWRSPVGRTSAYTFVGEFNRHWPYQETALYHTIPGIRYNRVEGLVLGLGLDPLEWDDYERSTIYGQVGYAFALKDVRYEAGLETRPLHTYQGNFDVKFGGAYHQNTATNDLWKSSWLENTLGAALFEQDFFDYYEVEGWTAYAVQRLTPRAQLSVGYRSDVYRSLENKTSWSLFDGSRDDFRLNPAIDRGRMNSFVAALEGGRVAGIHRLPRGYAFRLEAEVGRGLGGDFSFNRYLGDVRLYVPVNAFSRLTLRLRGGFATDGAPLQKHFTVGGVGSVRAYPQNWFSGTRLLLGNAEYVIEDVRLLDGIFRDFQLFGFADAGWVNTFGTDVFRLDDLIPAAGLGLGLDRNLRLELAWPLRDLAGTLSPTLWLRLNPTF